jgi:FkbM family methyltransferase
VNSVKIGRVSLRKGTLFKIAACVIAGICLAYYFPELILISSYLVGRSKCPFSQTIAVGKFHSHMSKITDQLKISSRRLQSDGGLELWSMPYGNRWILKGTEGDEFDVFAEQELKLYGEGSRGVQPNDVVIDCGANTGAFTRTALDMGASLVVAVEPAPEAIACLRRNLNREINKGLVKVYPKGVWDKEAILSFYGSGLGATFVGSPIATSRKIQVTTIDNIVKELQLNRVDFIKMDIEGAEPQALSGARRTLAKYKPRLAISGEHSVDEADRVRELVRRIAPSYISECGPCAYLDGFFAPIVLYFR